MELVYLYIGLINLIAFFVSFSDKRAAIRRRQRVPEKTLFVLAIIGGSVGLYLSMLTFRHKTKHFSFMAGVPFIILIQLAVIWFFFIRG